MNPAARGSWPHPVLSPAGDDVSPATFGFSLNPAADGDRWLLGVQAEHSDETLESLVRSGSASYALHVECPGTFYRAMFSTAERTAEFAIPATGILGKVEAVFMVVAAKDLSYRHPGQHPDYGSATFSVSAGQPLAVSWIKTFEAFLDADPVLELPSIFHIRKGDESTRLVEADFTGDRIVLILPPADLERYKAMLGDTKLRDLLATTLFLPALVQTFHYMRDMDGDELDEFKLDHRWCRILSLRLAKSGLDLDRGGDGHVCFLAAQKILRGPLRRSLDNIEFLFPVS